MLTVAILMIVSIIQIFLSPKKDVRYRNVDSVITAFVFFIVAFAFDMIAAASHVRVSNEELNYFIVAEAVVLLIIKIQTKRNDDLVKYGIPFKYTSGIRNKLISSFYDLEEKTPIVYTKSATDQIFNVAMCSVIVLVSVFAYQAYKYPAVGNTLFVPLSACALLVFLVEFCIFCSGTSKWGRLYAQYKQRITCKNRRQLAKMRFFSFSDFSYIFMKNFVWEPLHIMRATKFRWRKDAFKSYVRYYDFANNSKNEYISKEYNPELEAFIADNNLEVNELYVTAYNLIDRNQNVLIKTPSYVEFEPYFVAMIKMKVAKTQKIVLVVSNDEKKDLTANKINNAFNDYMGFDEIPLMQTIDDCVRIRKLRREKEEKKTEDTQRISHFSALTDNGTVPVETEDDRPIKSPDIVIAAPEDICDIENTEFIREIIDDLGLIIYYDFSDSVQEEALFAKIIHSVLDYNDKISTLYMADSFFDLEQVVDNFFSKRNLYEIKVPRTPANESYVMGWKAENINEMQSRTNPDASRDMGNHIPILYDAGACTENDFIVVEDEFDTYVENQLNFSNENISSRLDYHVGWTDVIGGNSVMCTVSDTYNNVAHTYLAMSGVGSASEYINIISRPYLLRNYLMYHLRFFTLYPGVLSSYSPGLIKTPKALAYEAIVKLFVVGCTEEQLVHYAEITGVCCEETPEDIIKALVMCAGCKKPEQLEIIKDVLGKYQINESVYRDIIDGSGLVEKIEFWTNRQVYVRNRREFSYLLPHQKIVLNGIKYTVEKIDGNRIELTDSNTREPMYISRPIRTCKIKVNDVEEYGSRIQNNSSSSISFSRLISDVEIKTYGNIIFKDCYHPFCDNPRYDYHKSTEPQMRQYENINVFNIRIGSRLVNSENSKRLSHLLALLLNEMLPTFFPRHSKRIVVACNGWTIDPDFEKQSISTLHAVAQADIEAEKESADNQMSLYILEDSPIETGLVNVFWQDEEFKYMLKVLEDYLYYLKYINRRERKEIFSASYISDLTLLKRILLEVINETFEVYDRNGNLDVAYNNKIRVSRNKFNNLEIMDNFEIYCDYCGKKIPHRTGGVPSYHFYAYSGLVSCMDCYKTAVCSELYDQDNVLGLAELINKWFTTKYKDEVMLNFYNYLEDAERVTETVVSPNENRYIVTDDSNADGVQGVASSGIAGKNSNVRITRNTEFVAITSDCKQSIPQLTDFARASYHVEDEGIPFILIRDGLPYNSYMSTLTHEMTHHWQYQNLSMEKLRYNVPGGGSNEFGQNIDLSSYRIEGHAEWEAIRYLKSHGARRLAHKNARNLNADRSEYGIGYKWMCRMMRIGGDDMRIPANRTLGFILKRNYYQLTKNSFALMRLYFGGQPQASGSVSEPNPDPNPTPDNPSQQASYYGYAQLSDNMRALYNCLLDGIALHQETIDIPDGFTFEDISTVHKIIRMDHPELFWYPAAFSMLNNTVTFTYPVSADDVPELQAKIDKSVAEYMSGLTENMSEYEVALCLFEKLINSLDYDTIGLEEQENNDAIGVEELDYLRTICGPFINRKAVCAGYARAFQYLLQKCGIECTYVKGKASADDSDSGEWHAWNLVKIDGDYYYVDVTWDDRSKTDQKIKDRTIDYDYFCITTEELLRSRSIDVPYEPPVCTATKANYFCRNGLVIDSYDVNTIISFAKANAEQGERVVRFKCSSSELFDNVREAIIADSLNIGREAFGSDSTDKLPSICTNERMRIITLSY